MNKKESKIIFLFIFLITSSCTYNSEMDRDDFMSYISDPCNGLNVVRTKKDYIFSLLYKPTELIVAQELARKQNISEKEINTIKRNYKQYAHFLLNISCKNKAFIKNQMYHQKIFKRLFENEMHNFVCIITSNKDTINLVDYNISTFYSMTKTNRIIFVFSSDKIRNVDYFDVLLKDNNILKTGNIKFRFYKKDMESIPKYNYST